jgi:Ig-like domain from next to BRCA1 gene
VSDVTVPDGTQFQPGAQFTKTWRMRSNGCAAWPVGSVWAFVEGDQMGAPASVPVSTTSIAGTIDISVQMTTPGTPGTYIGTWQLQGPDGTRFGDQAYVSIVVPLSPPRQLETGTIVHQAGARNGDGQLGIENGLDLDAVAVLQRNDSAVLFAVYVRGRDSFTLTNIPDGTYDLYFTLGEDWDSTNAKFTRRRNLSRFDDLFPFRTTSTTYSIWNVTLHPVVGGTAGSESVPEGEFPDLK